MDNRKKLKVANGLLSALLVAPVVASASTITAQESGGSTADSDRTVVYHNDFSQDPANDAALIQSGDAVLEWFTDFEIAGENESGVWVTDRTNDYDGIDIPFDQLGIEGGIDYSIYVTGYIDAGEEIPDGASVNIETVNGYT